MTTQAPVFWSERTLHFAKKERLDLEALQDDVEERKKLVDKSFALFLSRVVIPTIEKEAAVDLPKSVELNSEFVGKTVAFLATGRTGVIIDKPGSKCIIKLDHDGSEAKACLDELYLIKSCANAEDAIQKIIKACQYVPQDKDLCVGARVTIPKLHYQTATIMKKPDTSSGRNRTFTVKLEQNKTIMYFKSTSVRIIPPDAPIIGPLCAKRGRPPRGWAKEQRKLRKPTLLIPISKSSPEWTQSIKPPKLLPPIKSPLDATETDSEDDYSSIEEENGDDNDNIGERENAPKPANRRTGEVWL